MVIKINKGQKFGEWEYLGEQESMIRKGGGKVVYIKCRCSCGIEKYLCKNSLIRGISKSCGKHRDKRIYSDCHKRHGFWGTRFYKIWQCAKSRCNYIKDQAYNNYGGRGIVFTWDKFEDFKRDMYDSYLEHAAEYGEKNTTLDRIDNNGNYCKENCRWATYKEQCNNKRNNTIYKVEGICHTQSEWADIIGVTPEIVKGMYKRREFKKFIL